MLAVMSVRDKKVHKETNQLILQNTGPLMQLVLTADRPTGTDSRPTDWY